MKQSPMLTTTSGDCPQIPPPSYRRIYDVAARPLRTTWARGPWRVHAYNADGLLSATAYSDSKPFVSLAYDPRQYPTASSNTVAQYAYANSVFGAPTNEVAIIGTNAFTLTRRLDGRHRLAALSVDGQLHAAYTYDAENRLSVVSNDAFLVSYAYANDGWDAGYTVALTNGTILSRDVTRDPYRRHLVAAITNAVGQSVVSGYCYVYDLLGRAIARNADTFDYNDRSEVTVAFIEPSNTNRYEYDGIGNNRWTTVNGATNTYTVNALNQYTNIANGATIVPSYDMDGNMLTYGVWSYTWDAENRLSAVYSNAALIVSNAYDPMSRRVLKITPTATHTFVYDGWNLAQETIATASGVTTNRYIWGKDLSGTMQGAGGVGGLLAVSLNGPWYFPFYDNKGNITDYSSESGVIVATYTYNAFGKTIAQSGPMCDEFPYRFSTKYFDTITELYYYGYRYYSPELGRWVCRDPIGEVSGDNVYAFVANCPLDRVDLLGLEWMVKRDGASQADADCKCDTVEELAKKIGLSVSDYQKWLSPADGYALPSSATEIMKNRRFRIPNTVYAYWAGDVGSLGKWAVSWNGSVSYLNARGFQVIEYGHTSGSKYVLQNVLIAAANSRALHGFYFWGHGYAPYPSTGLTNKDGDPILVYTSIILPYKMALGLVFACDSNAGKPALYSNAPGGVWHGYRGTLIPLGSFHVQNWFSSGAQEAK